MADQRLGSLVTDNAQAGFDLAIMMARMGVKYTQPSDEVRPVYASDANALIASSHVIAVNFQTVAAANNYWRA